MLKTVCAGLSLFLALSVFADDSPLIHRPWFEARTPHFNIYSCGEPQQVFQVAGRLEQFSETYSALAGSQALVSPPIAVLVFPDYDSMKPFLPLYQGQPESIAGFFVHGEDENLIVLSLPPDNAETMDMSVVFHEYTHLLLRRNDQLWPLWLNEGMAEIYSTFQSTGYNAYIAEPIVRHLRTLAAQPMMPLDELFSVTHDSPQYNEQSRQGMFYAESWLLTHLLFAGNNAVLRQRFANFTPMLRAGKTPVEAFTGALGLTLPQMQAILQRYLEAGQFAPIQLNLKNPVSLANLATRPLTPVEIRFRLGDELMRIGQLDQAEKYFNDARQLAPASPLPHEGLGLLAIRRHQSDNALNEFKQSLNLGSTSYLTHYFYALKKYEAVEGGTISPEAFQELHDETLKSIVAMPNFGGSHELFGALEMSTTGDHQLGEQHLQLAAQIEPENLYYQLALGHAEIINKEPDVARKTLSVLLLPGVDAKLHDEATELLGKLNQ